MTLFGLDLILVLWIVLASLVALAGVRYAIRARASRRRGHAPRVDDAALRRILETGSLPGDDEPIDMDEVAEAEREFWSETWDEPEEYHR